MNRASPVGLPFTGWPLRPSRSSQSGEVSVQNTRFLGGFVLCALAPLALGALALACRAPAVLSPDAGPSPVRDPTRPAPDAADGGSPADAFSIGPLPEAGAVADAPGQAACPGSASAPTPQSCAALGVMVVAPYGGQYTCFDLGPVPGVPPQKYGGLTLTSDRCSTKLLIGGSANFPEGKLYAVTVRRDAFGHISGFEGTATVYADAPWNDGGVTFGPEGVLFITRWPRNELQQTRAGSTAADKVTALMAHGVGHSSASLSFVPRNLPGGGTLKLASWSVGQWYTINLRPDGQGLFEVASATQHLTLPGGPEGFVYVAAGSPLFTKHSLLVSEWTANAISVYDVDDKGDPQLPTRRDFITGLHGAEGAYRDPATGDFFFSTWGQAADRVIVVRGFAPVVID
jgi:hypothetical protein